MLFILLIVHEYSESIIACDIQALNVCAAELDCMGGTCSLYYCPEDRPFNELILDVAIQGDNSTSTFSSEGSICGGGGLTDIYAFNASEAGTYHFIVQADDNTVLDPVIYAKDLCDTPNSEEFACNDDYGPLGQSAIELYFDAGETVYLLVDSFLGSNTGAYTITVTAGPLP